MVIANCRVICESRADTVLEMSGVVTECDAGPWEMRLHLYCQVTGVSIPSFKAAGA